LIIRSAKKHFGCHVPVVMESMGRKAADVQQTDMTEEAFVCLLLFKSNRTPQWVHGTCARKSKRTQLSR